MGRGKTGSDATLSHFPSFTAGLLFFNYLLFLFEYLAKVSAEETATIPLLYMANGEYHKQLNKSLLSSKQDLRKSVVALSTG